jgi:hypothetical protein
MGKPMMDTLQVMVSSRYTMEEVRELMSAAGARLVFDGFAYGRGQPVRKLSYKAPVGPARSLVKFLPSGLRLIFHVSFAFDSAGRLTSRNVKGGL